MTTRPPAICDSCVRRDGDACTAYPDGIPDPILNEMADHRTSQPGDGGVVFEMDPNKQAEFDDWLATSTGV